MTWLISNKKALVETFYASLIFFSNGSEGAITESDQYHLYILYFSLSFHFQFTVCVSICISLFSLCVCVRVCACVFACEWACGGSSSHDKLPPLVCALIAFDTDSLSSLFSLL